MRRTWHTPSQLCHLVNHVWAVLHAVLVVCRLTEVPALRVLLTKLLPVLEQGASHAIGNKSQRVQRAHQELLRKPHSTPRSLQKSPDLELPRAAESFPLQTVVMRSKHTETGVKFPGLRDHGARSAAIFSRFICFTATCGNP